MGLYSLDRFNGFGLMMKAGDTVYSKAEIALEPKAQVYMRKDQGAVLTAAPFVAIMAAAAAPAKTEQQKAEEELAALEKAAHEAETAAVVEETLDIGEPEKTPWLLYGGIGLGALVLVGGVLYATKKKGAKKVAGYKRRRRRR